MPSTFALALASGKRNRREGYRVRRDRSSPRIAASAHTSENVLDSKEDAPAGLADAILHSRGIGQEHLAACVENRAVDVLAGVGIVKRGSDSLGRRASKTNGEIVNDSRTAIDHVSNIEDIQGKLELSPFAKDRDVLCEFQIPLVDPREASIIFLVLFSAFEIGMSIDQGKEGVSLGRSRSHRAFRRGFRPT